MFQILGNPIYRNLFAAQIVALLETGLATVALSLLAYDLAGSNAGAVLGTAFAIKMVANIEVAPVVGAVADRLRANLRPCSRHRRHSPRHSKLRSLTFCPKSATIPARFRSRNWPMTLRVLSARSSRRRCFRSSIFIGCSRARRLASLAHVARAVAADDGSSNVGQQGGRHERWAQQESFGRAAWRSWKRVPLVLTGCNTRSMRWSSAA